jgi:hypothetical protein
MKRSNNRALEGEREEGMKELQNCQRTFDLGIFVYNHNTTTTTTIKIMSNNNLSTQNGGVSGGNSTTTDRLQIALREVSLALDESKRASSSSAEREAELAVQLEAERASHAQREHNLVAANERLMSRVEELSETVARLQGQVSQFFIRFSL